MARGDMEKIVKNNHFLSLMKKSLNAITKQDQAEDNYEMTPDD